jgi:hypothetical protein
VHPQQPTQSWLSQPLDRTHAHISTTPSRHYFRISDIGVFRPESWTSRCATAAHHLLKEGGNLLPPIHHQLRSLGLLCKRPEDQIERRHLRLRRKSGSATPAISFAAGVGCPSHIPRVGCHPGQTTPTAPRHAAATLRQHRIASPTIVVSPTRVNGAAPRNGTARTSKLSP